MKKVSHNHGQGQAASELSSERQDRLDTDPSSDSSGSTTNDYFRGASKFCITKFKAQSTTVNAQGAKNVAIAMQYPEPGQMCILEAWRLLADHAAPNALHDASARCDPPRCDPDTRDGMIEDIMDFLRKRNSRSRKTRVLCLTGPAGVGKTALQQTIAEQCADLGILASSFFFSYTDPSRNTVACLVATIAYQLGMQNADLRDLIAVSVQEDPLIFMKTVTSQLESLIFKPLKRLQSDNDEPLSIPHALLIDGVDECRTQDQGQVLLAVRRLVDCNAPVPFCIFLASRPERIILEALQDQGELEGLADRLHLGEDGNTTKNIRRMLQRRLLELQVSPLDCDLDRVVNAASGRYVYAATVVRYVKTPNKSPNENWRTIVGWASPNLSGTSSPAVRDPLHILYENILSSAKASYEAERTSGDSTDFILLLMALVTLTRHVDVRYLCKVRSLPGMQEGLWERLTRDIQSLVKVSVVPDGTIRLEKGIEFYHKSCLDFLTDPKLSLRLHVTNKDIDEYLMGLCLRCFTQFIDQGFDADSDVSYLLDDLIQYLGHTNTPEERSKRGTKHLLGKAVYTSLVHFTNHEGWDKILQWFERRKMAVCRSISFDVTALRLEDYLHVVLGDLEAWKNWRYNLVLRRRLKGARLDLAEYRRNSESNVLDMWRRVPFTDCFEIGEGGPILACQSPMDSRDWSDDYEE